MEKFEVFALRMHIIQENMYYKVKCINSEVFERFAERPDAYRIVEFAEMRFDEAPSWCGRDMNEGDKKQS